MPKDFGPPDRSSSLPRKQIFKIVIILVSSFINTQLFHIHGVNAVPVFYAQVD